VESTETGSELLDNHPGEFGVHYANGPILKTAEKKGLPDY